MTKATKGRTYAEVMALAKPREIVVKLCVDGQLAAEADRLSDKLAALKDKPGMSLADGSERAEVQAELDEIAALMREAEVEFRFRALPPKEYSDLFAEHPPRPGKQEEWNPETAAPALIAACAIEPEMTLPEVEALLARMNEHTRAVLWSGAWRANQAPTNIPS